tara:strand:+ start:1738 stop:1974 length:237 start_codon:yes stop_codon:yes gene_type:complete
MNDKDKKQWIFSPGISNLEIDEREVYENLSREDKILAEIQAQTRDIRNIKSNVRFFFWITFISLIISLLTTLFITTNF